MKHQVIIYYTFCPRTCEGPGIYLKYQRKLADKMLNRGFINIFNTEFTRDNVGKGKYGKPYWKGKEAIQFNVSNTSGLVVCALSDTEIGVDAEKMRNIRMAVIRRCCAPEEIAYITEGGLCSEEERNDSGKGNLHLNGGEEILLRERFLQLWTLKESYIKMTGEGMRFPMKEAVFSIEEQDGGFRITCSQSGFFVQKRIKEYWISLCAKEEVEVIWREWKLEELEKTVGYYGKNMQ